MSRRLSVLLAVTAAALVTTLPATAAQNLTTVTLAVNSDAFVITLKSGGKKVTKLKPGKYSFRLVDKTTIHNVHLLKGTKTVNDAKKKPVITSVAAKVTRTVTVTLTKGKYTFVCDPHLTTMIGTFTVA